MPDPCADAIAAYRAALQKLLDLLGALDEAQRSLSVAQSTLALVERALETGGGDANMLAMEAQAKTQLANAERAADAAGKPIAAARAAVAAAFDAMQAACESFSTIDLTIGAAHLRVPADLHFTRDLERQLGVLRHLPEGEVNLVNRITVEAHDGPRAEYVDELTKTRHTGVTLGQNTRGNITIFYGPILAHPLLHGPDHTRLGDVLKHEIAHSIFNNLPDAASDAWTKFWGRNLPAMPTGYAKSNAADGFCECYEFYRDGKHLDRDAANALRGALHAP